MNTLIIDTRQDPLLSEIGITFPVTCAELHASLSTYLHLEGTLSLSVTNERLYAMADAADLRSQACSAIAIAVNGAAEQIGRPARIPEYAEGLLSSVRTQLAEHWSAQYGAEPESLVITRVTMDPEQQAMLDRMEKAAAFARKTPEEKIRSMAERLLIAQAEASRRLWKTETWNCTCGAHNAGNFCTACGKPRTWICACKNVNAGNFCTNCGKPRV